VEQALYSVTRGAAYQYFEESRKGSIEVGKQADLVILASNPLRSDPALLADIDIEETFSRGRSVYSAPVD
jgi:predicted amidohydrolase YtcJ